MRELVWELDGLRLRVTVPADSGVGDDQPPAAFLWASAIARRASSGQVIAADTVTPDGLSVLCVWPGGGNGLSAGPWQIQVRAGASEAAARTIYDEAVTVRPSISLP